jgi:hypothetical protein
MLKAHLASLCFKCFICLRGMLQVLHMDVGIERDVAHVVYVTMCLFKMFHLFQMYVCKRFDLDVAYVSHIYCKSMFKVPQSYVVASIFKLQVVSVYQKIKL